MLKGIPNNISADLLKALAEMGHGDTIVIGDHFFPNVTMAEVGIPLEAKGNTTVELLKSILQLIPVDSNYEEFPVNIISPDPGFEYTLPERPALWDEIIATVKEADPKAGVGFYTRSQFYKEAVKAYVLVNTSEEQPYGCVIVKKGVK